MVETKQVSSSNEMSLSKANKLSLNCLVAPEKVAKFIGYWLETCNKTSSASQYRPSIRFQRKRCQASSLQESRQIAIRQLIGILPGYPSGYLGKINCSQPRSTHSTMKYEKHPISVLLLLVSSLGLRVICSEILQPTNPGRLLDHLVRVGPEESRDETSSVNQLGEEIIKPESSGLGEGLGYKSTSLRNAFLRSPTNPSNSITASAVTGMESSQITPKELKSNWFLIFGKKLKLRYPQSLERVKLLSRKYSCLNPKLPGDHKERSKFHSHSMNCQQEETPCSSHSRTDSCTPSLDQGSWVEWNKENGHNHLGSHANQDKVDEEFFDALDSDLPDLYSETDVKKTLEPVDLNSWPEGIPPTYQAPKDLIYSHYNCLDNKKAKLIFEAALGILEIMWKMLPTEKYNWDEMITQIGGDANGIWDRMFYKWLKEGLKECMEKWVQEYKNRRIDVLGMDLGESLFSILVSDKEQTQAASEAASTKLIQYCVNVQKVLKRSQMTTSNSDIHGFKTLHCVFLKRQHTPMNTNSSNITFLRIDI
ncbi:hypothetical protein CROQUDRAFT_105316 [Cronartium quercuum f. sp. fusiforme G11]|uniref:Uncharacterized protein n=1 Tax=Cronartium quercuum f. sp. fusiforme G11 TaxID=708437 RepID=A0A9P6NRY1_9BASI|nr:hypothetical protein CROQUDRAFT_105316 [Cronartium quercuum f. sp. fusiforme G11]